MVQVENSLRDLVGSKESHQTVWHFHLLWWSHLLPKGMLHWMTLTSTYLLPLPCQNRSHFLSILRSLQLNQGQGFQESLLLHALRSTRKVMALSPLWGPGDETRLLPTKCRLSIVKASRVHKRQHLLMNAILHGIIFSCNMVCIFKD